jgi:hypothetical protein
MRLPKSIRRDVRLAKSKWCDLNKPLLDSLVGVLRRHHLSLVCGDLLLIDGRWYVTHSGLLRIAVRKHCQGMRVQPVKEFCDSNSSRYAFRATVYTSPSCKGFVGYGDADPSNVSASVHGAEMRVAETRAVNRALRKAYGIGICSVEEIGAFVGQPGATSESKKLPQNVNANGNGNGNHGGLEKRRETNPPEGGSSTFRRSVVCGSSPSSFAKRRMEMPKLWSHGSASGSSQGVPQSRWAGYQGESDYIVCRLPCRRASAMFLRSFSAIVPGKVHTVVPDSLGSV